MPVKTSMIQQAYVFALDLSPRQQRACLSHAGAARFAYNWGVAAIADALDARAAEVERDGKATTSIPGHFDLCRMWTAHKNDPANKLDWVGENSVCVYQAALRDAHVAWQAFFDSRRGARAGRRVGRPRFKKKRKAKVSFQVHGKGLRVVDARHIYLPKIGTVRVHEPTRKLRRRLRKDPLPCPACDGAGQEATKTKTGQKTRKCPTCRGHKEVPYARIVRASVSQAPTGRWQVALTVEGVRDIRTGPSRRQLFGGPVGVSFGTDKLAVLSSGVVIPSPRPFERGLRRLATAQRTLSRRQPGRQTRPGAGRRERARVRVAKMHDKTKRIRRDALEKLTSTLVHRHSAIGIEEIDVQHILRHGSASMTKQDRRARNRALADTAIGSARWMLTHKATWYGSRLLTVDPKQSTDRTCSACGATKTKALSPAERQFRCGSCGCSTDRRLNAARLLFKLAHEELRADAPSGGESKNAHGGDVGPGAVRRDGQSLANWEARAGPRSGKTGTLRW